MEPSKIMGIATIAVLAGCTASVEGRSTPAQPAVASEPGPAALSASPGGVQVSGRVVGADGSPQPSVQVVRLALDPYLAPIVSSQTDATGAFTLDGLGSGTQEWLLFQLAGHTPLYQAFDMASGPMQTLPAAILLSNDEAASFAQSLGFTLDTAKSTIRIPVLTTDENGRQMPLHAGEYQVSIVPPAGVPVVALDGDAVAFNVVGGSPYSVTVTRGGNPCLPAGHPGLAAADGSVKIGTLEGAFTVAPTLVCP